MKLKIFLLSIGFLLATPIFAAANQGVPDSQKEKMENHFDCEGKPCKHHGERHKDWKIKMEEREQKLLSLVDQYTPEKKAEWQQVLKESKELREQWMSPENAEKREKWRNEKFEKMKQLKKQLEEGKITKEEFFKKVHEGKKAGHWKTYHDLKNAVENKDEKQVPVLLNQLLGQFKEHNQQLKKMLESNLEVQQ
jgi:hypothetical protein